MLIDLDDTTHGLVGNKLVSDNANWNTGIAAWASWCIGDGMAATKSRSRQRFVQILGIRAVQFGDDFTLETTGNVWTWQRSRREEKMGSFECEMIHSSIPQTNTQI
jgi:hypothetical protein